MLRRVSWPAVLLLCLGLVLHDHLIQRLATSTHDATGLTVNREIDLTAATVALVTFGAVVVAAWALVVARRQLGALALQTRATGLLAFDERWESEFLLDSRATIAELLNEVTLEVLDGSQDATGDEEQLKIKERFAERLGRLRNENGGQYLRVLSICGFFETVAYAAQKGYVHLDDVIGLFGLSILEYGRIFELHIAELESDPADDPKRFRAFLWLVQQCQE